MPLVTCGPEVKFCQSSFQVMLAYLPVLGRCFSSSLSSLSTMPPVTVLVVVFCVPMPIVTSFLACACETEGNRARDSHIAGLKRRKNQGGRGVRVVVVMRTSRWVD